MDGGVVAHRPDVDEYRRFIRGREIPDRGGERCDEYLCKFEFRRGDMDLEGRRAQLVRRGDVVHGTIPDRHQPRRVYLYRREFRRSLRMDAGAHGFPARLGERGDVVHRTIPDRGGGWRQNLCQQQLWRKRRVLGRNGVEPRVDFGGGVRGDGTIPDRGCAKCANLYKFQLRRGCVVCRG